MKTYQNHPLSLTECGEGAVPAPAGAAVCPGWGLPAPGGAGPPDPRLEPVAATGLSRKQTVWLLSGWEGPCFQMDPGASVLRGLTASRLDVAVTQLCGPARCAPRSHVSPLTPVSNRGSNAIAWVQHCLLRVLPLQTRRPLWRLEGGGCYHRLMKRPVDHQKSRMCED